MTNLKIVQICPLTGGGSPPRQWLLEMLTRSYRDRIPNQLSSLALLRGSSGIHIFFSWLTQTSIFFWGRHLFCGVYHTWCAQEKGKGERQGVLQLRRERAQCHGLQEGACSIRQTPMSQLWQAGAHVENMPAEEAHRCRSFPWARRTHGSSHS